jgi:tagaturonate reductase
MMRDDRMGKFIRQTVFEEILPTINVPDAERFAGEVMERFANPYLKHFLWDITLQGTMKMRFRVVPSIVEYHRRFGRAPQHLALGFAAFLWLMRGDLQDTQRLADGALPADDRAEYIRAKWATRGTVTHSRGMTAFVEDICADESLWSVDLSALSGFPAAVARYLSIIERDGAIAAIDECARLEKSVPTPRPAAAAAGRR